MRNAILVDAGPLIALFDRDDTYHQKTVDFVRDKGLKFVTTTAVITEVSHVLDFNLRAQLAFFEWVMREGVILHPIEQDDMARIVQLTQRYSDRPMDFTDATLVVAAEKRGIRQILSIDSDFDIYRLPGKVMIENLFKE